MNLRTFLKKNRGNKYGLFGLCFSIAILLIFSLIMPHTDVTTARAIIFRIQLLLLLGFAFMGLGVFMGSFNTGFKGELRTTKELIKLGPEYKRLDGIFLSKDNPYSKSQFDHIVVGPNGIFHIETKDYFGKLFFSELGFQREFDRYADNPNPQVKRHEETLLNVLNGYDVDVVGILNFSNPNSELEGENKEFLTVQLKDLTSTILNYKPKEILKPDEVNKIFETLLSYSKPQKSLSFFSFLHSKPFKYGVISFSIFYILFIGTNMVLELNSEKNSENGTSHKKMSSINNNKGFEVSANSEKIFQDLFNDVNAIDTNNKLLTKSDINQFCKKWDNSELEFKLSPKIRLNIRRACHTDSSESRIQYLTSLKNNLSLKIQEYKK